MQTILILALAVPWLLVGAQALAMYLLMRDHQRDHHEMAGGHAEIGQRLKDVELLLTRVSATVGQAAQPSTPPGLPVGTVAPVFALPDLGGRERRLEEFLGTPFVVVFFSTTCGYCREMAPRLGQIPQNARRVLLISRGDPDEHLRMAAENKWRCDVVVEPGADVMNSYKAFGTPTGYLIDGEGRIATDLVVGADALLELIADGAGTQSSAEGLTAESLREKEAAAIERARSAGLAVRASTLQRDGLPAGTPAPTFVLSDLQGEERRLEDFLNKRVLLVFSDPNCGPCDALAPDLVRLQDRHSSNNLQVVMVSRGDLKENETKAKQHGFTFPVLLQKHWEVSKDYAMFATPVGYLIDQQGVIAKDVAVGKSAILGLV
jgi:peroxiredoxin